MGVSFQISKRGTKCKFKPPITESTKFNESSEISSESFQLVSNNESQGKNEEAVGLTSSSISVGRDHSSGEDEVSFILNLYLDGYSIVKTLENENTQHPAFQDGLKLLRPYDRTSEGLFAAIESGRLPGGILDDIPCKFVEGTVTCEVRDYRKCISDPGSDISYPNELGTINKVSLKMSLENVVKDISLMADDSWTYGNLMEVESRILNALQPKLCLDPVPRLDRLCQNPASLKVNLDLVGARKRRLRQIPEVTVTSNNRPNGKKICIAQPPSSSYDVMSQHAQDNMYTQGPANQRTQRTMHDPVQGHNLPPGASLAFQDMPISYAENMNSTATAKVASQEGQLSPYSIFNKQAGLGPSGQGPSMDRFQGSEVQWRNQMLHHHQNARGAQYPQLVGEGMANPDGVKLEKVEPNMMKTDVHMEAEGSQMDQRVQQRFQNPLMRPAYSQPGWNNLSQQMEKQNQKDEQFSKRKPIQSPRLSAGAVAQSPLSARSADISCGSPASLGQVLREKSGVGPVKGAGRASSVTSSANDTIHHLQHQAQGAAKKRTNSLPKNPAISGVGSPVSVNTMGGGPMNVSNPSISSPQFTERNMLERFAKIEVVAMRHQLNCKKKNKADDFPRKPRAFSARELLGCLAGASNNENVDDSREMSKSLVGGHVNVCKIRVVNLQPAMQGNMLPAPVRTRMILSEKPTDGTVAMHYGDLSDGDYLNAEDYLPTLPNTQWADLLAAQFCTLVIREGYVIEEVVQPRPPRSNAPSNSQPNASGGTPNNSTVDTQQYSEPIESKPTVSNSLNSTAGMHPPGNSQMSAGQMSGVTMPARPQQMDPQQPLQQHLPHQQSQLQNQPSMMQQVQSQFQRSPLMQPNNSMPQLNAFGPGSNLPMGNQMGYKPSPSLQMLQQPGQQSQLQSAQMQRRMMMGLGTGMGMGNNMGLGGLSNVMGMGGAKGMSTAGMSAAMAPMSGMGGNMGQNTMGLSQANIISQHLRAGTLNPQALAAAQKLKMMHNRGMLPGTQSGITGMPGAARQMQQPGAGGLSMLSQSLNRGNMGQMQRTAMGQMGMPNLMPGINAQLSQQQLQQLQQMQQQQSQSRQQALPQQESTSQLQGVLSPQQVSSSSMMGIPQQMNQQFTPQQQASPQQMGQRTPMSPPLSSGPVHPMSAGNPEGCPASPALSSQTLGSVGSITNTNGLAGSE
ncbi:protein PHYTOCHROME-DEPENDENT LATE-FLOWERING-like [Silene latifolia]|uniref:protein PHYTOCHROME-DEPENDENT LATE-FLOWERING-like n=1 Tax=Silene latifolia TaxID=37657 RepID=UPI003D774EC7